MAQLLLVGDVATIAIAQDPDDEDLIKATCLIHPKTNWTCTWSGRYDTTDDAWQYAESHADRG
jgi:hypothetical protein